MFFLNYNIWQNRPKKLLNKRIKNKQKQRTSNKKKENTREYRMYNAYAREEILSC